MVLSKQSVAEAGKEFQNHAVGREGCVNSSRIVWWSERTSSSIHNSEQRRAVHRQMHGATRHIHTLRQVLLPSNKNIVSQPQATRYVSMFQVIAPWSVKQLWGWKTSYVRAKCVNISKTVGVTSKGTIKMTNRKLHMRFRLAPEGVTSWVKVETKVMRWYLQDEVNQDENEPDVVDAMKQEVDSRHKSTNIEKRFVIWNEEDVGTYLNLAP